MLPEFPPNISRLPRDLECVRDLEEFDGPILTELKSAEGSIYLEKWCAREGGTVRTLVVRSELRAIAQYLAGRVTMRDLMVRHSDGVGFIVDKNADETKAVYVVLVAGLPAEYLPKDTAVHDASLRPQWDRSPQNFLLNQEWDGRLLAKIERLYLDAYAFDYFMAYGSSAPVPDILDYVYDGGFPIMHAFNHLRASVPKADRAKAAGVSANSPGVFTIDAPTPTAGRIVVTMSSLAGSASAYDNVHQWSRLKPQKADHVPTHSATEQLIRLCEKLGLDAKRLLPQLGTTKNPAEIDPLRVLVAAKLAASYYRRLWTLFSPDAGVEFLGPDVVDDEPAAMSFEEEDEDPDDWH